MNSKADAVETIRAVRMKRPIPTRENRGRKPIYKLNELQIGEGYDFFVTNTARDLKVFRCSLIASARYHDVKIKTVFDSGKSILSVWRIA